MYGKSPFIQDYNYNKATSIIPYIQMHLRRQMSAVRKKEYPSISLSNAVSILETIRDKNIKTSQALSSELGYSDKAHGGIFFYKRTALSKHYNLIEPSKSEVILTRRGQRIVHPLNEADRVLALHESAIGVPLLKSLYESLGPDFHQDDFKPTLSKMTAASPSELAVIGKGIEDIYRDAIQYLRPPADHHERRTEDPGPAPHPVMHMPPRGNPSDSASVQLADDSTPTFDQPVRNLHSEDGYFIRIVLDADVIEEAVAVLEALKKRVKTKGPSANPKEKDSADSEANPLSEN